MGENGKSASVFRLPRNNSPSSLCLEEQKLLIGVPEKMPIRLPTAPLAKALGIPADKITEKEIFIEAQVYPGYVSYLRAKEQTGIERAVLSGVFSADKFTGDSFPRFNHAVAAQETYLQVFLGFASPQQRQLNAEIVKGAACETAQQMRQTAFTKANEGGFGVSPNAWFDAITAKIDLMKTVENRIADDLFPNPLRAGA